MNPQSTTEPQRAQSNGEFNQITEAEAVIGAVIEVHRALGPGLLESAYSACLCRELALREIPFRREVPLPIVYKGVQLDCGYRIDLIAAERALIEIKAVESIEPIHEAQLLTYLPPEPHSPWVNPGFSCSYMRDGIIRRII